MEEIAEKDNAVDTETLVKEVRKALTDMMTDEKAPLPHIGIHLSMARVGMGISSKMAATMMGMTPKQLYQYEVGIKEAKGEHRKNMIDFINRFASKVGIRGRHD